MSSLTSWMKHALPCGYSYWVLARSARRFHDYRTNCPCRNFYPRRIGEQTDVEPHRRVERCRIGSSTIRSIHHKNLAVCFAEITVLHTQSAIVRVIRWMSWRTGFRVRKCFVRRKNIWKRRPWWRAPTMTSALQRSPVKKITLLLSSVISAVHIPIRSGRTASLSRR